MIAFAGCTLSESFLGRGRDPVVDGKSIVGWRATDLLSAAITAMKIWPFDRVA
jgi:hypothetical protein